MASPQPKNVAPVAKAPQRILLASCWNASAAGDYRQQLCEDGFEVEPVGIDESRWLGPVEGFDLVLVDATEEPVAAIELSGYIKQSSPRQRVALLLGDRAGTMPHHFEADAVLSGTPTPDQFLGIMHLLLVSTSAAPGAAARKPPRRISSRLDGGMPSVG